MFFCLVGHRFLLFFIWCGQHRPFHSCRMQGLPPKEPEEYAHLLPNSPKGPSLEGEVNNNISSEIGSSNPLVESSLPVSLLLNVIRDPFFLRINSLGDVVAEEYTRIHSRPFVESGVDDPPFHSESFRTPVQHF